MSVPILFHGEEHETVVNKMRSEAMNILSVDDYNSLISHGDYQEVTPTSKSYLYTTDVIQSIITQSTLPPLNGKSRIIALLSADRMLPTHANALLKVLEDSPSYFHFMLVTTKYNDILKTILSRVQKRYIEGVGQLLDYKLIIQEIFVNLKEEKFLSFVDKLEELEKSMLENNLDTEKKMRHFLETFLNFHIKTLSQKHLLAGVIHKLEVLINNTITAYNGNIRIKHIIENLFLETQQLTHNI